MKRRNFPTFFLGAVALLSWAMLGLMPDPVIAAVIEESNGQATDAEGAFSPQSLMQSVIEYDNFGPHRTGSEGDQKAAEWLEQHFTANGFTVEQQQFEFSYHAPARASLTIADSQVEGLPLWPPVRTSEHGIFAPIRYYRPENPDGVKGAIAVLDLVHRRHSSVHEAGILDQLKAARKAGAKAIIAITHGPTGGTIALNSGLKPGDLGIPVLTIGPKPATEILNAAQSGQSGIVVVTGPKPKLNAVSYNIISTVEAIAPTDDRRWVIVSTPFSSWFHAAAERGPGLAIFRAMAEWAPKAHPDKNFLFVATSGHELGKIGAEVFLKHAVPKPDEVSLWLHLGSGLAARDFQEYGPLLLPLPSADTQRFLAGSPTLVSTLQQEFKGIGGLENVHPADPRTVAGELRTILLAGYEPVIGAFGSHRFHHHAQDRPDKLNSDMLAPVAQAFRDALSAALSRPAQ